MMGLPSGVAGSSLASQVWYLFQFSFYSRIDFNARMKIACHSERATVSVNFIAVYELVA